jgi:hypothetical protein
LGLCAAGALFNLTLELTCTCCTCSWQVGADVMNPVAQKMPGCPGGQLRVSSQERETGGRQVKSANAIYWRQSREAILVDQRNAFLRSVTKPKSSSNACTFKYKPLAPKCYKRFCLGLHRPSAHFFSALAATAVAALGSNCKPCSQTPELVQLCNEKPFKSSTTTMLQFWKRSASRVLK